MLVDIKRYTTYSTGQNHQKCPKCHFSIGTKITFEDDNFTFWTHNAPECGRKSCTTYNELCENEKAHDPSEVAAFKSKIASTKKRKHAPEPRSWEEVVDKEHVKQLKEKLAANPPGANPDKLDNAPQTSTPISNLESFTFGLAGLRKRVQQQTNKTIPGALSIQVVKEHEKVLFTATSTTTTSPQVVTSSQTSQHQLTTIEQQKKDLEAQLEALKMKEIELKSKAAKEANALLHFTILFEKCADLSDELMTAMFQNFLEKRRKTTS